MKTLIRSVIAAALGAVSTLALASEITVGGKNFTEQLLLSEMTAQLLEAKGMDIDRAEGMGSSVLRSAMENGQVDVYWEYTGTSLVTYNKVTERLSAEETYNRVKELDGAKGIVWLDASAANNTYALAVRAGDDKGLSTLSDLAAAYTADTDLKMGVNAEFPKREDGLLGLQKAYDFRAGRANLAPMQSGLIYQALRDGDIDVGLVFATDGRIAAFDFKVLEDDQGFFPNYALTPVVRAEVLAEHPEMGDALNAVSALLSDDVMQALNGRVAVDKEEISDVAKDFLMSNGLI